MGLWDVLRGQSKPRKANLDALFALPVRGHDPRGRAGPAPHRQRCRLLPGGRGSRRQPHPAGGRPTSSSVDGGPHTESRVDEYGYTWLTVRTDPPDVAALVTDLHAVNSALEVQGFGSGLLCSTVGFRADAGRAVFVVYLYKQGTFYPFCPTGPTSRDTLMERQVRDAVGGDLPVEEDTSRWMPIWGIQDS